MVYECSGGTPRKFVIKKPLKAGDVIRKGQYFRFEVTCSLTDDAVKFWCDNSTSYLCKDVEGAHLTYYYASNTRVINEAQATQDLTVPAELAPNLYLLQSYWEAYKIPIILGIVALGGFAGFIALRKRK
jgi:hypothetical protein